MKQKFIHEYMSGPEAETCDGCNCHLTWPTMHNQFMAKMIVLISVLALSFIPLSVAQAETWKIATLEWPPYTCSNCYRNGAAADMLRQTLAKKGITVEFVFYPWVQAQKNGKKKSFVGYFPAWKEGVLPSFTRSEALFVSPVVFLERTASPLKWNTLKDLTGKTFGATAGYGNTAEYNELVKNGSFKTVSALNEESTIRRLIAGTVEAVLIDYFVGDYYLKNLFSAHKDKISLNPKVVESKSLHLAFNEDSLRKVDVLNNALDKAEFQKGVEDYIKKGK